MMLTMFFLVYSIALKQKASTTNQSDEMNRKIGNNNSQTFDSACIEFHSSETNARKVSIQRFTTDGYDADHVYVLVLSTSDFHCGQGRRDQGAILCV